MVLEHGDGYETSELDQRTLSSVTCTRTRAGKTHVLLYILLSCSYGALAELHTEGSGGIVETPCSEVYGSSGIEMRLRLVRGWVVRAASAIRWGHVALVTRIWYRLRIAWCGGSAGVPLVALGRHGCRGRLGNVGGMGRDRVLKRRRARVVCVVGHGGGGRESKRDEGSLRHVTRA